MGNGGLTNKGLSGAAFCELYVLYRQPLYHLAIKHGASSETVEDITQDIFASLWQRRATLQIHNLNAYLAVAVKNRVIRAAIHEQKKKELPATNATEQNNGPILLTAAFIKKAIGSLSIVAQLLVQYTKFYGYSTRQIANLLGIPERAAARRLAKAIHELRVLCFFA